MAKRRTLYLPVMIAVTVAVACAVALLAISQKADARHWLAGPEYATLKHRLEDAHAAVEAALIEARPRVRMNEGRES